MSQILCLAVYFYNTCRYHKVQEILQIFKERFSQPFISFGYPDFDGLHYLESIGKYHVCKRMNKAWTNYFFFPISYISEFCLEHSICLKNTLIPLLVSFHMLNVLSNHRLGNRSQCLQSLTQLQNLLLYDKETYAPFEYRDIAWHVLGICQQVFGDLYGALQSYQMSLRQKQFHKLHKATVIRMCLVLYQLNV